MSEITFALLLEITISTPKRVNMAIVTSGVWWYYLAGLFVFYI